MTRFTTLRRALVGDPDLVLIEIGGNDACASTPTPTATFRAQVRAGLERWPRATSRATSS